MLRIAENRVFLKTKFGEYTGRILYGGDGFYFRDSSGNNYRPLYDAGFRDYKAREALFKKILGYYPAAGGDWPWCRTKEDVLKILKYIGDKYSSKQKNFVNLSSWILF